MFIEGKFVGARRDGLPGWFYSVAELLLSRNHAPIGLPLNVVIREGLEWMRLARGASWKGRLARSNRESLLADLKWSVKSVGGNVRGLLAVQLHTCQRDFEALCTSPDAILDLPPESRTAPEWQNSLGSHEQLLAALSDDDAILACWADVVDVSKQEQVDTSKLGEHVKLLDALLELRGVRSREVFQDVVAILVSDTGRPLSHLLVDQLAAEILSGAAREEAVRALLVAQAPAGERVVWLGYRNARVIHHLEAGPVEFYNARWFVPNVREGRRSEIARFEEMAELLAFPALFKVATHVDEVDRVTVLARVDMGKGAVLDAVAEAEGIVDAIYEMTLFQSGGARPILSETALLIDGHLRSTGHGVPDRLAIDDHFGMNVTSDTLEEVAPRFGEAFAYGSDLRFLRAAIRVFGEASRSRSREATFGLERAVDTRSLVALDDRVVEHLASHSGLAPNELVRQLGTEWPQSRWLKDLATAVTIALTETRVLGDQEPLELTRQLRPSSGNAYDLDAVAAHLDDLRRLCDGHVEENFVNAVLDSLTKLSRYNELIRQHRDEWELLGARHRRVRNAVVHGNPATPALVESVLDTSEFLSNYGMQIATEALANGETTAALLKRRSVEREGFAERSYISGEDAR